MPIKVKRYFWLNVNILYRKTCFSVLYAELVYSEKRFLRFIFANSWVSELKDVTVRLVAEPNETIVLDDTVGFSFIQVETEILSDDTFAIQTARNIEDVKSELIREICDCKLKRRSDFNDDWSVDLKDFAFFAQGWLECVADMPQDIYPDDCIDLMDLIIFSEEWLK